MGAIQVSESAGKQEKNVRLAFDGGEEDSKTICALGKGLLAFNGIMGAV